MLPLAIAGSIAIAAALAAWVLVAYLKTRLTSIEAMLIRFVVGPAVGWIGYAVLAPQHDNAVSLVCLTIVAVAALAVIVAQQRGGRRRQAEKE